MDLINNPSGYGVEREVINVIEEAKLLDNLVVFTTVPTYADLLALLPVTKTTYVQVLSDTVRNNGNASEYHIWSPARIYWQASQRV